MNVLVKKKNKMKTYNTKIINIGYPKQILYCYYSRSLVLDFSNRQKIDYYST